MTDRPVGPGYQDYAERVDARFTMQLPDGRTAGLVLTECTGEPRSFSLSFKADPQAPVEQGLYQVSADGLGPEVVFLVPVARRSHDPDFPLEYQAIFNCMPVQGGST
jgi:hypothetical protein